MIVITCTGDFINKGWSAAGVIDLGHCVCKKSGHHCSNCLPMKLKWCSNQETSGNCSFSHRISSVINNDTADANDEAVNWDRQGMQDVILPAPVSDHPVKESHVPPPGTAFLWGKLDSDAFCKVVDDCYKEVVHWKRNIVLILTGGLVRLS